MASNIARSARVTSSECPFATILEAMAGLLRCLAQSQHHFREALPCGAMVIHAGKAQILEGLRTEPVCKLVDGGVEGQLATGHTAQNRADFGGCHRRKNRLRSLISLTLPALKYNHLIHRIARDLPSDDAA
jgi:hypothetical protein